MLFRSFAILIRSKRLLFGTFPAMVWLFEGGAVMAPNVKLPDELVKQAGKIAAIEHRSVPKQIEFYFKIAAIAEANPELSFTLIKEILRSDSEAIAGKYQFG